MRIALGVAALASVVALAAASHSQSRAGILKVETGGDSSQTRIVVELDRPTHGQLAGSDSPAKISLKLTHAAGAGPMTGQGSGLLANWSVAAAHGDADLRLTLARPAHIERRFLLPPDATLPVYRYVIDLAADDASGRGPAPVVRAGLQAAPTAGRKVVVIDAGHGGKDPGAAGLRTREKDLTIVAARLLRERLLRTGHYAVVMTREDDRYIPLERRVEIARRANADLFISLHADSDPDHSLRGAAVYTLSEPGAGRVAKHVFETADWFTDMSLPGPDQSVNRILLDLTQRDTRSRSSVFAEDLLGRLTGRVPLRRRGHRGAAFMVLLAPDVPAVLLEMGFITNPEDEVELSDPRRRMQLVEGVAEAIDSYFGQGARFAAR